MRKFVLSTFLLISVSAPSFAGGLLTNTNQHIAFLRNIARDASTEIDAVYSNPAGVAFMPDGWSLSFNVQSAYQTRTIKSTFAPFAGYGGSATKTFKGNAAAPFVPSLQAVFKKKNWAVMGSFAVTGGGGKASFDHGLGSFESQVAMLPVLMNALSTPLGLPSLGGNTQYAVNSYMKGSQIIYGIQLGAAYSFWDHLSVSAGFRVNYVNNGYEGRISNIQTNPGGGALVSANTYLQGVLSGLTPGDPRYATVEGLVGASADKNLDCTQTGWGVTPVLGVHFHGGKWDVAVKYEMKTSLNVENDTKVDDTGQFADGVNTPHDLPALLTAGVKFAILPSLRISAGYHHFFDKQAKMANDKQKYVEHGTNEYLAGIEWNITKKFLISGGYQYTQYSLADEFETDMSFALSSYSIGFGAAYDFLPNLRVNIAYFFTTYQDRTKNMAVYDNYQLPTGQNYPPGQDVFSRTNKVFGVGIDYRFGAKKANK